ncbi:type II secretion system protein [Novosphingobium aromaticivorans DSM 12444]|uniref:Type II secretion system protein n=2 Tax=Novosphingobium aromaticivorans TaxID=48935 RepID=Q2G858_NOVAD|nr:type II secretion system F family protein [Novosphingobium aromaticivorans]ABD25965.1 type II secretion system protein [Novosphingobium aromaticivorans DSM 12444]SCY96862.1 tight adherence protein C [Novosphingobium aromaticivorans]
MDFILQNALLRSLILALFFAATVIAAFSAISYFTRRAQVRAHLRTVSVDSGASNGAETSLAQSRSGPFWSIVNVIERTGLSLADSNPDALRTKLIAAGFEATEAPTIYTLSRLILVFLLPACAISYLMLTGSELTIFKLYMVGSVSGLLGLIAPAWFVRIKADRRMEAITNGFPNCLDLILVCVEAGLGMEAAFDRVSREIARAEPQVAHLLVRTNLHLRAGATREEALHRMATLAGVDEIRSFATLLIQSEKLGTSIGTTLRVFASEMREKRRMRAEEKAHRLPVLISLPLVTCMLPTMIGVLMIPAAIRVVRKLLPVMLG